MEYYVFRLPMNNPWRSRSWSKEFNLTREDYVLVYVGKIENGKEVLERIYAKLNIDHPADYRVPSLSVSDVVGLRNRGGLEYYYVDGIGFEKVWEELK